jgi:hypothetical protein
MNNIEQIQELIRVLDATLSKINPEGLVTGHNALSITNFFINIPNMKTYLGEEFVGRIDEEILKAKNKTNVREHVKKILMYPKFEYDAWNNFDIDEKLLEIIHRDLSNINFKLTIVDGKVYASTLNGWINKLIFDQIHNLLPPEVVINSESSHITVVNSNIVQDIGIDNVTEFVDKYVDIFSLNYGEIKSTISRDWPVFSKCYVIKIQSDYLELFIRDFNETFKKNIKPSPHITFAIVPRSLI